MKCTFVTSLLLLLCLNNLYAQNQLTTFFEDANTFFAKYVIDGEVAYKAIEQDTTLTNLVKQIQTADLSHTDSLAQQAFLINAYNLNALEQIVKLMPLKSALNNKVLLIEPFITVAGEACTFEELVNRLRLLNTDPLFHFALVNTSFSFSTLNNFAYSPSNLNQQLLKQTRQVVNHPKFKDDPAKIKFPGFLNKYREDFIGVKHGNFNYVNQYLIKYINQFRVSPISYGITVSFTKVNKSSLKKFILHVVLDTLQIGNLMYGPYKPMAMLAPGDGAIKLSNSVSRTFKFRPDAVRNKYQNTSSFANHIIECRFGTAPKLNTGIQIEYQFSNYLSNLKTKVPFLNIYRKIENNDITGTFNYREKGLKAIGPKFWLSPFKQHPDLIIESTFLFPAIKGFEEFDSYYYFDNGLSIETKMNYYTFLKSKWLLDIKVGILFTDIGKNNYEYNFRNAFTLPVQLSMYYLTNKNFIVYSSFDTGFNTGKTKISVTNFDLYKQRGFSSLNQTGIIVRCSPSFEINTSYFIMFNGFSYTELYWNNDDKMWSESSWENVSTQKITGFDLNFRFTF